MSAQDPPLVPQGDMATTHSDVADPAAAPAAAQATTPASDVAAEASAPVAAQATDESLVLGSAVCTEHL